MGILATANWGLAPGYTVIGITLGGIYALERIARDSQADQGPVMEVLTRLFGSMRPSGRLAPLLQQPP